MKSSGLKQYNADPDLAKISAFSSGVARRPGNSDVIVFTQYIQVFDAR